MVSDSIANASIPMACANAKDFAKKKRANRSAKLKQCKLDARREQWLSQVKNKGSKDEISGCDGIHARSTHGRNERNQSMKNLVINPRDGEIVGSMHNDSDSESSSSSPTSHNSSVLGSNDSGSNFTGSSSSSSSSSSGGCCSGSITEEDEEGDDGCLDDWEAVADALAATDDKHGQQSPSSDLQSPAKHEKFSQSTHPVDLTDRTASGNDILTQKPECGGMVHRASANCRAWRPDDAFRPQSLPNLSKQLSYPMNSERHYGHGVTAWGSKNVMKAPSSCPICYEDLDVTDSSFLPCSCGFRLCLFCHKRILEEDGRCPGCRKQYEYNHVKGNATIDGGSLTFRLARSCSMVTRS